MGRGLGPSPWAADVSETTPWKNKASNPERWGIGEDIGVYGSGNVHISKGQVLMNRGLGVIHTLVRLGGWSPPDKKWFGFGLV